MIVSLLIGKIYTWKSNSEDIRDSYLFDQIFLAVYILYTTAVNLYYTAPLVFGLVLHSSFIVQIQELPTHLFLVIYAICLLFYHERQQITQYQLEAHDKTQIEASQ